MIDLILNRQVEFLDSIGIPQAQSAETGPITGQIVGGVRAPVDLHPFIVALLSASVQDDYSAQFCAGTLYNDLYVVTAAHCVDYLASTSAVAILVGTQTLSTTTSSAGKRIGVSRITIHPQWNADTFNFDVAVIRLAAPASGIRTASLTARDSTPATDSQATVSGWGTINYGSNRFPYVLRAVVVPVVDRATCNADTSYNGQFLDSMFCAGTNTTDSCQGDSGGPITGIDNTTLIGIVSWGNGCAWDSYPGVYTRVGNVGVNDFITQNTVVPTQRPTTSPTQLPTRRPTGTPTRQPSRQPSSAPTTRPTATATSTPTRYVSVLLLLMLRGRVAWLLHCTRTQPCAATFFILTFTTTTTTTNDIKQGPIEEPDSCAIADPDTAAHAAANGTAADACPHSADDHLIKCGDCGGLFEQ